MILELEEKRVAVRGGLLVGCAITVVMIFFAIAAVGLIASVATAVNRRGKEKRERLNHLQHSDTELAYLLFPHTRSAIDSKENEKKPPPISNHQQNEDVPTEYDVYERKAVVYLYTSPLNELPTAVCTAYHHWEIVVHFEDDVYRTLDGYGDDKGRMCCRYKKERSTEYTNQIELGHVVTSPHRLRECAETNILNGTPYNSAQNNCQHWVLEVAREIGMDIFKKLQEIDRPSEIIALLVGMGSALFSNFTKSAKSSM